MHISSSSSLHQSKTINNDILLSAELGLDRERMQQTPKNMSSNETKWRENVLKAYSSLDDTIQPNTEKVMRQGQSFLTCVEETRKTFQTLEESLTEVNDTQLPLEVQNDIRTKATNSLQEAENMLKSLEKEVKETENYARKLVVRLTEIEKEKNDFMEARSSCDNLKEILERIGE